MQKTVRRSACLLFILTLAAAIVIPTVADPISQAIGDQATSETTDDDVLFAEDYELSDTANVVGEP